MHADYLQKRLVVLDVVHLEAEADFGALVAAEPLVDAADLVVVVVEVDSVAVVVADSVAVAAAVDSAAVVVVDLAVAVVEADFEDHNARVLLVTKWHTCKYHGGRALMSAATLLLRSARSCCCDVV